MIKKTLVFLCLLGAVEMAAASTTMTFMFHNSSSSTVTLTPDNLPFGVKSTPQSVASGQTAATEAIRDAGDRHR